MSPGRFKLTNPKLFGFDIETYDHDNKFLCGSIVGDDDYHFFTKKKSDLIEEFHKKIFYESKIVATNLAFDFFGTFEGSQDIQCFDTLFRGSDLIYAKTRIKNGQFLSITSSKEQKKGSHSLTFIDTMSFCPYSVEKLGKIIGVPKQKYPDFLSRKLSKPDFKVFYDFYMQLKNNPDHPRPDFIGRKPKTQEEWQILEEYNKNDCKVSLEFMRFLYQSFHKLGANVRNTIASTSMSLFRNKFLKDTYPLLKTNILLDIFESYYGGRTEAIGRGRLYSDGDNKRLYKIYDVNSLYPAMSLKDMPDPRHTYVKHNANTEYIENYMGMSSVDITMPEGLKYPCLPVRAGKVVFGHGNLSGWWTHAELKQAMQDGAEINDIKKTIYFPAVCHPFDSYVRTLYDLRCQYKREGNPMELVVKSCLNALTGKFGQKFIGRESFIPKDSFDFDTINELEKFEEVHDFIRTVKDCEPSSFCQPQWISYITAYGRLHLLGLLREYDAIYCDTDSITTKADVEESKGLGGLKREITITEGVIVRPKFYAMKGYESEDKSKEYVRLKGLGWRPDYLQFQDIVSDAIHHDGGYQGYTKFLRIKESKRRGMNVNSVVPISKNFSVEDDKRCWPAAFNPFDFQMSRSQEIIDGMTRADRDKKMARAMQDWDRRGQLKMAEFIKSDHFDRFSVGKDITAEEHLRMMMEDARHE